MKYPFGGKCNSGVPGVSVRCASLSQAESRRVHNRSAVPALVCRHKVCCKCAAKVTPPISRRVDKKLWHVAQQSFETATSRTVNQPKYEHSKSHGSMQHTSLFFWKLQDTGLAMASNVNLTFAGTLLDTYSSFTIIPPSQPVSCVLSIALCSVTVLMVLHKQLPTDRSVVLHHAFLSFLCEAKSL